MNYIHPTAVIGPNVEMGDNNYIGPLCIIGYPAEHKDYFPKDFWASPDEIFPYYYGKVIIGNNCKFTGLVTIDGGTEKETRIGDNVWMLKHSHVGHDAEIKDGVTISCGAKIGGHCEVGKGANVGLNAVIHQRVIVPEGCMIGASAFVGKKTEMFPNQKYAGVPARWLGYNEKNNNKNNDKIL